MQALDEEIMVTYFKMEAAQSERLRMMRIWHPELMKWNKKGAPPLETWSKRYKLQALQELGLSEAYYQRMVETEAVEKAKLEELASTHCLGPHFERIKGVSMYLCGAFVAASGDIARAPTVMSFWKGMGLDIVSQTCPDCKGNGDLCRTCGGTGSVASVPRRERGNKAKLRRIPCLPHVSKIGEQIRQQVLRSGGKLREFYDRERDEINTTHPEYSKMRQMKHALRVTQKILYSCLWKEWRVSYGLPAPEPYAFSILQHDPSHLVTISDFYD